MRIVIADPEPKVRRALTVLLHEQTGWYVVGHAGAIQELEKQVNCLKPHIILVDWGLPGLNHGEYIQKVVKDRLPIVIIMSWRPEIAVFSQSLGVKHFINKLESPEKLLDLFKTIQNCLHPVQNKY